jgi:carbon-monoxide dehydrogenase large subunit
MVPSSSTEEPISHTAWVGQPIKRLDDRRLLTGRGAFVDDLRPPGCLHAAFLRSPHAHARVTRIDTRPALARPGVRLAVHGGSPGACQLGGIRPVLTTPGIACPTRPILAREVVRFVGEALAVVVAHSRYAAEDALESIEVEYEALPALAEPAAALAPGAVRIHPEVPGNCYLDSSLDRGPVDRAFAEAEVIVDWRRFTSSRQAGSPLETRGVLAAPAAEARLTVWTSTQVAHRVREVIATSLGLDEQAVQVITPDVGGGFGVKAQVYPEEVCLAWLARELGAPVKWIEDRREHLTGAGHARDQVVEARLAATRAGVITALEARVTADVGAYGIYPTGPALEPMGTRAMLPGPYRVPAYRCQARAVATNKAPEGPYRGVGLPVSTLVHERLMDLLAHQVGLAPEEVRRRNLIPSESLPLTTLTGMAYDSGDYRACLDRALASLGVGDWRARQAAARQRQDAVQLGIGIACYVEYTGMGSETFRGRGMLSMQGADTSRLRVDAEGHVRLVSSLSEMGQGVQTSLSQLAADGLDLPLEAIRFQNTDTDQVSSGTGTFASRSAVLGAGSLQHACQLLRQRILELAAEDLEVAPGDLELDHGRVWVRGVPERATDLRHLARAHPGDLDVSATYDPPRAAFPNATHAAVLAVDRRTGLARILAYVVVEDCGRVINPLIVDGQIQGAVAQGLGGALLEALAYDDLGQPLTASFVDYLLPTSAEMPLLRVSHLQTPSPVVPGGFKGVGEGGTLAPPAVVANALSDALGLEINHLPASPPRLRALLRGV